MILDEPTAEQLIAIAAVNHLASAYSEAVNRRAVREAVEVYAVNGVLRSPTTDDAVGRDAIARTIETAIAPLEFLFNVVHGGLVRVTGNQARARFPVSEWARRSSDGRGILFLGYYDDVL